MVSKFRVLMAAFLGVVLLVNAFGTTVSTPARAENPVPAVIPQQLLARPIALAYLKNARRLVVANRDSASLSTIDPDAKQLVATWKVPDAANLSDLIVSEDGFLALVCSSTLNRVWLLKRHDDGQFSVLQVIDVPVGPVGLSWLPGEKQAVVSCQWGRAVVICDVSPTAGEGKRLAIRHTVNLLHSPRRILPVQDGERLVVADQFSGILSLIRVADGKLERTIKIPGQNIHGLALSANGQHVIIAQQILNQVAETSRDAVFWGIVMSNSLRMIPLKNLLDPKREPLMDADIHFLGEVHHGASDPTDVKLGFDETMLTSLGGVDELAIGIHLDHSFDRVKVGRRPVAIATDAEGKLAFVANQFSDSISMVDIAKRKNLGEVSLHGTQTPREPTVVEKGEALFHDGRLSLDGWYSCHSCHSSGHTVGLLNDNLGDENYGAAKRIPSLLGINDTAPFLWSGRVGSLNQQTRKSITTTMHGEDPTDAQVDQLVAYMRTLPAPPRIPITDAAQAARGAKIFDDHDCARCHAPPTFTSAETYDVGLKDEHGRAKFNPPSLRGLRYRSPYLHDHRAETLKEVFTKHKHPTETNWSDQELVDLIAFLESL